ncbi:cadherin-like beta sandwich domain-containing protein, partial [Mucilaginibacter sp.]|uniref:cadherin-like beta sandwich domain-containing protein n=1 Tax=Mucilaginibacter sp. TaxID=1882438 RepID=UPI0026289863
MNANLLSSRKSFLAIRHFVKVSLLITTALFGAGITLYAVAKAGSKENFANRHYVYNTGNHVVKNGTSYTASKKAWFTNTPVAPIINYGSHHITFHQGTAVSLTPTSSGVGAPGGYSDPVVVGTGLSSGAAGIALDAAGNMYVADGGTNSIKLVLADGSNTTVIASGIFNLLADVAIDCNGNVYAADQQNIWEIPAGGGSPFTVGSGFTEPTGVAVDKAGNIYVADYDFGIGAAAVYKMANDGTGITRIDNGISGASKIKLDIAGNVYVTDLNAGNLYEIHADGSPQSLLATGFSFPSGLAVDGFGNVYVEDNSTKKTYKVVPGGSTPVDLGISLSSPLGIAIDAAYNLYITDANESGVNKISPAGGYFISAPLPAGLSFDSTTGTISGTPTTLTAEKRYIITAYNGAGGVSDTLRIKVNAPVPVISYTNPPVYTAGTTITPLVPTASGVDAPGYAAPGLVANGFLAPLGIAADTLGNVYVADKGNNLVKKINVDAGTSVCMGSGFNTPSGVAVDAAGNIYVADSGNGLVKKIPADNSGIVNIGTGFNVPVGVAVDVAGNVYVADAGNAAVYKVPVSGAQVTMATDFDDLTGIAVDQHSNVYVSDGSASSVYKIPAKGGGAVDIGCLFNFPANVAVDAAGNVYVADGYDSHVYKIDGGRGNPVNTGFTYDFPSGVAIDPSGNLFVADASANTLYKVTPSGGYNLKTALPAGLRFNDTTGTISGKPTAAIAAASYTVIAYNAGGGASASFSIEVDNPPAPTISYASLQTYTAGTAITPLAPTASGVGAPGYNSTPITLAAGFNQPGGTAIDAAGNVYFADSGNNKVMMLPVGGGPAIELGSGFVFPTGVALDAAGNIYVADQGNGLVKKMPAGGGTPVSIGTGFSGPGSVAVDAAGNVYVADSSDGTVYKICAGSGNTVQLGGGFISLTGIAVNGKDNLYFTDGGDHAVYKVSLAGGIPYNIGCYFNYPSGIAVDNSGNVYVTDRDDNTLYRITKGGNKQVPIGTGFNAPTGVAVDAMGTVYIGDTGNNAIEKLIPSGGYFISTVLPAGLKFSGTTGTISGTPTAVSAAKDYKITAYNYGGSASATVNIKVVLPPPPTLSYSSPMIYPVNVAITPLMPTASGVAAPGYSNTLAVIDTGFNFPIGLGLDHAGNIYVANAGNDTLYKIPVGGGTRTSVGSGFTGPTGVAFDAVGNIYVADAGNSMVKKIPVGGGAPIEIGSGFNNPAGIAADAAGNVYVADQGNSAIYKIAAGNGQVTTITSAIAIPTGIAIDGAGNIYVTDQSTGFIFKLAKGSNTPVDMGYTFNAPIGLAIDANGNLYVADASVGQVKEIPAGGGALVTIGGFFIPVGVATDNAGNLYVSDAGVNTVYKVKPGGGYYISPALPAGLSFNSAAGTISGTPTAPSPAADYTVTAYNFGGNVSAVINIKVSSNNALLTSLKLNPVATMTAVPGPDFRDYTATVNNTVASVTLKPVTQDPTSTVEINGVAVASGTASASIPLQVGSNIITTVVTAEDGITTKTYSIAVTRSVATNALLTSLSFNPVVTKTTVPGSNFRDYTATVSNSVSSIAVIAVTQDSVSTVKVNGVAVVSGATSASIPLQAGANLITTEVTAGDGITSNIYSIVINRQPSTNAILNSLSFDPYVTRTVVSGANFRDYTATVKTSVSSVTVTPVTQDSTATVKINNVTVASGAASASIPLNIGDNTITTVVTAGDGTTKNTYSIVITREANVLLTSLKLNPAVMLTTVPGPDFKDYTATVNNIVSTVTVTPVTQDPTSTVKVNGVSVISGAASTDIPLNVGNNTITTIVTAADGVTTNTYNITVTRALPSNALLTALTFNPSITKTAVPGTNFRDYTATISNSVSSVTVSPVTQDPTSTVKVNNATVASGTASGSISLNVGDNTITTVVTAANGITTNTYSMVITRQAPGGLASLYDEKLVAVAPVRSNGIVVHQNLSPNGDGNSDVLVIDGIAAYPDNKLQIMSRNGALVYEAKGYDNATKVFDGHASTNGKLQQAGTYFYSLTYKA